MYVYTHLMMCPFHVCLECRWRGNESNDVGVPGGERKAMIRRGWWEKEVNGGVCVSVLKNKVSV